MVVTAFCNMCTAVNNNKSMNLNRSNGLIIWEECRKQRSEHVSSCGLFVIYFSNLKFNLLRTLKYYFVNTLYI